jgi:hypothetical protein
LHVGQNDCLGFFFDLYNLLSAVLREEDASIGIHIRNAISSRVIIQCKVVIIVNIIRIIVLIGA